MSKRFVRQDSVRHFRLGNEWRRPKGRHSKMRKRRKSYPGKVLIGYKTPRKKEGKINSLKPILVHNVKELIKLKADNIAIIANIGARKKSEIIKIAQEKKIQILNIKGGSK